MKRLLTAALLVFVLLANIVAVAEEQQEELSSVEKEAQESKITISFRVGDSELDINGDKTQVTTPYVENGTTLVPLRVITEAFGAQVDWEEATQGITLTFADIVIKLNIGSKECQVNGVTTALLEAPQLKGDTTMVPLRFISENFGADVQYDEETEQIDVVKVVANTNSVKDFSLILKRSDREKTGDSYYGWSMAIPKKYSLAERSFSGLYNAFVSDDATELLTIGIRYKQEDATLDTVSNAFLTAFDNCILQEQETRSQGGVSVACLTFKYKGEILTARLAVVDDYVFEVLYSNDDSKKFDAEKTDIEAMMNSLSFQYTGSDETVEDLSDVTQGLREFQDKNYGIKLGVLPDMYQQDIKENVICFSSYPKNIDDVQLDFAIIVTSAESGLTADAWLENEIKNCKKDYNEKFLKFSEKKEAYNKNGTWMELDTQIQHPNYSAYAREYYIIKDGYKYQVQLLATANQEADLSSECAKMAPMFDALLLSGVNTEEVGKIIDKDFLEETVTYKTVSNAAKDWTTKIPSTWTEIKTDQVVGYISDDGGMMFTVYVEQLDTAVNYYQFTEMLNESYNNLKKEGTIDNLRLDKTTIDGVECRAVEFLQKQNSEIYGEITYQMVQYITIQNKKVIEFNFFMPEFLASEERLSLKDEIVSNITINKE